MRKRIAILVLALLFCLPGAAQEKRPRVILYTAYRQEGWGDAVQVGCVDEEGGLWLLEGSDADLRWPKTCEEQLAYLATSKDLAYAGRLDGEELFDIRGLIACARACEGSPRGWMDDAGTESGVAVRYGNEDAPEPVLLGVTGDSLFENRDPNAQALYRRLRALFPGVRSYADECEGWGFAPVPLREFLGWEDVDLTDAGIEATRIDCEAGPVPLALSAEETLELRALLESGLVIGKENANVATGGAIVWTFCGETGDPLCALELYKGLLALEDGMYALALPR